MISEDEEYLDYEQDEGAHAQRHQVWNEKIHAIGAEQEAASRDLYRRYINVAGAESSRRIAGGSTSDSLSVCISTWNVGNAVPPENLHPWVPSGGGGADIIAVCGQEATYDSSKTVRTRPLGHLTGTILSATGLKGNKVPPHCEITVVPHNPKAKTRPETSVRTWQADGMLESASWNAKFDSYSDAKPKGQTGSKLPDKDARLPRLSVYRESAKLKISVYAKSTL
jgi:hypothetical protein